MGVDARRLGSGSQQQMLMRQQILIERRGVCNQYGDAPGCAAANAPNTLPEARGAARIANQYASREPTDVDPQLQRAGCDDTLHAAISQARLNCSPFLTPVTCSVPPDHVRSNAQSLCILAQGHDELFHSQAGPAETDRLQPVRDQVTNEKPCIFGWRPPDAKGFVGDRGVIQHNRAVRLQSSAVIHENDRVTQERARQLTGIGHCRRRTDETGITAIEPAQTSQSPDHARYLTAKDAPVGVHLIHHNIGKIPDQLAPARMIGENARVEHIGVGDEDARPVPGCRPRGRPRVSVVCRHQTAVQPEAL